MTDAATPGTAPATTPTTPEGIADLAERLFAAEETKDPAKAEPEATPEPEPEAEPAENQEAEEVKAEDTRPEWQRTKHKVRVNGNDQEIEYDELVKGYSRLEDYKAKTAKVSARERELTDGVAQERKRLADSANFYLQQSQILDPILADGARTDWTKLAQEDPATYVAKWAMYQQRRAIVQKAQVDHQAAQERSEVKRVEGEMSELVEKWPDWGDEKKRPEIAKGLRDFLITEAGYDPEEADGIKDHRALLIIRDAMAYRTWKKTQSDAAKKRVAEPPKTAKPGASKQGETPPETARLKALRSKATNTRDPMDVANLAEAIFGRG